MPHGRPMPETHRLLSTCDEYIFAEHPAAGFWLIGVLLMQIMVLFDLIPVYFR